LPAGGGFVVSNFANLCRNECSLCVNFAEAVYTQRLLHYVLFHFVCKYFIKMRAHLGDRQWDNFANTWAYHDLFEANALHVKCNDPVRNGINFAGLQFYIV
jgi:hypothetical protein